ncbi:MAG: Demethylrebeccamycin-D-glucose O-methyltransferase [Pseudomonadota bacterium]|jgi:SAM-dependent methyltransferase
MCQAAAQPSPDIRSAVRAVYAGAEGRLWELIMGEQIHIDGFSSSLALAERAGVRAGGSAVDLCCCSGAGLRFLARMRGVASGVGVDMTAEQLALGRERNRRDGVEARIRFVQADATATGLPAASADLVWGEDAWCYVPERAALVAEAARLLKPGGTLACTDWCWGVRRPAAADAQRFRAFMKFPELFAAADYAVACATAGLRVEVCEDTGRFAPAIERYLADITTQRTWDALAIIGFDQAMAQAIIGEMRHALALARAGALAQVMVVARKP